MSIDRLMLIRKKIKVHAVSGLIHGLPERIIYHIVCHRGRTCFHIINVVCIVFDNLNLNGVIFHFLYS